MIKTDVLYALKLRSFPLSLFSNLNPAGNGLVFAMIPISHQNKKNKTIPIFLDLQDSKKYLLVANPATGVNLCNRAEYKKLC
jgi:hypothetical protein